MSCRAESGGGGRGASPAERAAVVVSTEWLAARLDRPAHAADAVRVVDVRGKVLPPGNTPRYLAKRSDYDEAHIPGAAFLDWTADIIDPADPVPMQVAPPAAFAAKMNEIGVGDGTLVVVYDDYDHIFAGRLAWALRYYGHDAVRILDGGWLRWLAEHRPTEGRTAGTTSARATAGPATARPFHARPVPALRRTADEVAHALGRPDVLLVDARPPEQYAGAVSAASRAGHIPGARNVPYASLVDPATQRFVSPSEMARVFGAAGVDVGALPANIIVYCNGGVSCSVPLHALRMLGREDVAVYDGSWNEWGEDPSRPIRAGRQP